MENVKTKEQKSYAVLKEQFGYKNKLQAPRLLKVVISVGVGSLKDKKKIDLIEDKLSIITGQKAAQRSAKKSIATFKVREGDVSGLQVTLREQKMFDFLDRFINIALPRTRDFRGISNSIVDGIGNATIGIRENTIFPEMADEDLANVFGLAVTIVTSAKTKPEARAFLSQIGIPFKKETESDLKKKKSKK